MTDQTPEQPVDAEIDESAVEPETTTNDLTQQDDVWVDENQAPAPLPDVDSDGNEVYLDDEDDSEGGAQ